MTNSLEKVVSKCNCEGECVCIEKESGGIEMRQRDNVLGALLPRDNIEEGVFAPPPLHQPSIKKIIVLVVVLLVFFITNSVVQTATGISQLKVTRCVEIMFV